jgi:hypothetical protein
MEDWDAAVADTGRSPAHSTTHQRICLSIRIGPFEDPAAGIVVIARRILKEQSTREVTTIRIHCINAITVLVKKTTGERERLHLAAFGKSVLSEVFGLPFFGQCLIDLLVQASNLKLHSKNKN